MFMPSSNEIILIILAFSVSVKDTFPGRNANMLTVCDPFRKRTQVSAFLTVHGNN